MANTDSLSKAVQALAGHCDGAVSLDGVGFAGPDVKWGHYFATISEAEWGDEYRYVIRERLGKYRRQLADYGIDYDSLPSVTKPATVPSRISKYDHKRTVEAAKPKTVSWDGHQLVIEFPYDGATVAAVKGSLNSRKFNPTTKAWTAPASQGNVEGFRTLLRDHGFLFTDEAVQELRKASSKAIGPIKLTDKGFAIHMDDVDWDIVGELKDIRRAVGGQYEGSTQTNYIPEAPSAASAMAQFIAEHGSKFDVDPRISEKLSDLIEKGKVRAAEREARFEASKQIEGEYEIPGLAITPYPFQQAGIKYAVEHTDGRLMIADEQGLGKTLQAIAVLEVKDAFPAVIVCPGHLKENWSREIAKAIPGKIIQMVEGQKPVALASDIHILSYEILQYHVPAIRKLMPKALILDESHKVKNRDSKRTKAAKDIVDYLGLDLEVVLLLTGTPMPNRPFDLIAQLDILGKLDDFGGFKGFITDYVGWEHNGYGYNFNGAIKSNLGKLNDRLREVGYLRRTKAEVLPDLPAIQRSVVPMDLSDTKAYQAARANIRDYLRAQEKDSGGTFMTEVNTFRQLTAKLKLDSVIEWITTFLESDEKLIVFAHHKDIQDGLVAAFPEAAKVLAKDRQKEAERTANVDRFQNDDDCKLIICSLEVAQTGLTLTAASNVAFVELGWTPDIHEQGEARCYGRVNDAHGANAYYLLAKNTVDEYLSKLIESKRAVIKAAADGGEYEDFDIQGELVEWLKGDDDG